MTLKCEDCDLIPKVEGAGTIQERSPWPVQVMHNGVLVARDCYCGPWMTRLIGSLKGHHEPQEEKVFHTVISLLETADTMVEFGSYWAYYSLWFLQRFPDARTILVEPDPNLIEMGKFNYKLNQRQGTFVHAAVAAQPSIPMPFKCESDGAERLVARVSADSLFEELHLEKIDILHADIQGTELEMLHGLKNIIEKGRLSYLFISTHDEAISGDFLIHEKCLEWIKQHNGHIIAEHTVEESFSGDGLIVASFDPARRLTVSISHNRASNSLFGSPSFKLAEMAQRLSAVPSVPLPPPTSSPPDPVLASQLALMHQSTKNLNQRLKQCTSSINRRLQLDSTPSKSFSSILFNVRRLRKHFLQRRLEQTVKTRLHTLRKMRKTEVVLGLHALFEVLKEDQVVSPALIQHHQWEFEVLQKVIKMVEIATGYSLKSATLLDIGANVGMVGMQMVASGLMKRCISFEPDPTNFSLLWSNVRLNGLENRFELQPVALGGQTGECKFELSSSNCGDHRVRAKDHESTVDKYDESDREVIHVPMRSLDEALEKCPGDFKRKIGLCWIDVQGLEGEVLRGGEKHFSKHGWPSVLEFWPYGMSRADMDAETLAKLLKKSWTKFTVLEATGNDWHPVSHVTNLWNSVGPDGDFVNLLMMR